MCQLQQREALITSQSSTLCTELIFTGRPSWVSRNLIETTSTRLCTHSWLKLHIFLASSCSCLFICTYTCYGVSCTGKSGSGIGDWGCGIPFWGGGARVFRLIAKFAALFLGGKWCHQFLCACCMKHAAHDHLILKVPDVFGSRSLWHLNVLIVLSKFRVWYTCTCKVGKITFFGLK